MTLSIQQWMGFLSLAVAAVAYAPYFWTILRGDTRPHVFSWVIWGMLEAIAFAAQRAGHAGPGSWATGITTIACIGVVLLSLRQGEKNITRTDCYSFGAALLAIPVWVLAKDPLWSVILITGIDATGFAPSYRKAWHRPYEDLPFTYFVSAVKFAVSLFAMDHISLVTALYPASLVVTNTGFVIMVMLRRRKHAAAANPA